MQDTFRIFAPVCNMLMEASFQSRFSAAPLRRHRLTLPHINCLETDIPGPERGRIVADGDYEYLSEGYYACLEAEADGAAATPTCADVLDAYVVPIALERVRLAGLPTPRWYLTNEHFQTPALLYGINPFARNHVLVSDPVEGPPAARKMSRQGKYVICCQELPAGSSPVEFEAVAGRSVQRRFEPWASALFDLFGLPLARIRLIDTPDGLLFSAIERLPRKKLSPAARTLFTTCLSSKELRPVG